MGKLRNRPPPIVKTWKVCLRRLAVINRMDQSLIILIGFTAGVIFLILLVGWAYEQLVRELNITPDPRTKRVVLALFMAIPLLIAVFTLPGVLARSNQERSFALRLTPAPATLDVSTGVPAGVPAVTPASPTLIPTQAGEVPNRTPAAPILASTQAAGDPDRPAASPTLAPTLTVPVDAPSETATPPPLFKRVASGNFQKATPALPAAGAVETTPLPTAAQDELPETTAPPPGSKRAVAGDFPKATSNPQSAGAGVESPESTASLGEKRAVAAGFPKATPTPVALPETGAEQPPAAAPTAVPPEPGPSSEGAHNPQGKIVYACQLFRDTNRDQICLINADGSGFRRLTTDDFADYNYPSLSPDGKSVVYSGRVTGAFEIYELDLDSGETRQLTNSLGSALAPAVSPDGSLIVFTLRADDRQTLWVMDRDGSNARQVLSASQAGGWDPVWSPDGSQLLFAAQVGGAVQLFTVELDGSNLRQASNMVGLLGRSDWSPDGATIATYAGESWRREIYLMDADGSNSRPITAGGNNLAPSFSPDGEWLTFTSYRDHFGNQNGCEIYIMRTDGSQVTRLTANDYCDWQPRWGP